MSKPGKILDPSQGHHAGGEILQLFGKNPFVEKETHLRNSEGKAVTCSGKGPRSYHVLRPPVKEHKRKKKGLKTTQLHQKWGC